MRLREILAQDLLANTGRKGQWALIASLLYLPSFATVFYFRLALKLKSWGFFRIANILWRNNIARTACHLHLDSKIGPGLILPHPTGIVIGSGVQIGCSVTIYQNVTIGRGMREERYPMIGNEAIIFPNAVVVGAITIGRRAVIGAGSIVIADVPDGAIVAGNPAKLLRMRDEPATLPSSRDDAINADSGPRTAP